MKIYLVGGAVRDKLLGLAIKERDYVVVGGTETAMLQQGFRQVGKEFPVFLHPQTREEYALARMERKVKAGYQGFTFDISPEVSLKEDLARRDLTINAMAYDLDTGELIDFFGGQQDIQNKLLRHVSPAFVEDPVRLLRVGRFFARYAYLGFTVAPETLALLQKMTVAGEVNALVAERVWKELERALGEKNPEKFFELLDTCQALPILFPHLTVSSPGVQALKQAASLTDDTVVRLAALLHALPEAKKTIVELCQRYRLPNAYREVALLTALHVETLLSPPPLSAETVITLLNTLDIYRREPRFRLVVMASQAIAAARGLSFQASWWLEAAKVAQAVPVQELIEKGFAANELAIQLKEKRREKIAKWLASR